MSIGFAQVQSTQDGFVSINQQGANYADRPSFSSSLNQGLSVTTIKMERQTLIVGVGGYLSEEG